jgi:hypothetical protein
MAARIISCRIPWIQKNDIGKREMPNVPCNERQAVFDSRSGEHSIHDRQRNPVSLCGRS